MAVEIGEEMTEGNGKEEPRMDVEEMPIEKSKSENKGVVEVEIGEASKKKQIEEMPI